MRIVIGLDWSEQAFSAVQTAVRLYRPQALTLVHGVDLRNFESPLFAPAIAKEAYQEFREAMLKAGEQLLDQAVALLPSDIQSVTRVCRVGNPADVVLETAQTAGADLVVTGSRRRGRAAELFLGSVSHRLLLHAPCSSLIVKRPIDRLRRVLAAVEASDDAIRLRRWLRAFPFRHPVEVVLLSVVPTFQPGDPVAIPAFNQWQEAAYRAAEYSIKAAAAELSGSEYSATAVVHTGDPAEVIERESRSCDLVVVGSHSRKALQRFLLGSVSHSVSHAVACPVLVVRQQ